MLTFLEKALAALQIAGHYLLLALKTVGNFLLWLLSSLVELISRAIDWARYNLTPHMQTVLLAVIVALIVVGVALLFTGHGCASTASEDEPEAQQAPPEVTYTPNEADLRSLNYEDGTIASFSLVEEGNQMYATLSEEENQAITSELSYFQNKGDNVGFLIANLNTGSGYCYNIDTRIYGASTYKAPISLFICEQYLETGQLKKSSVSTRIENAIIWSDNTSYRSLKHNYDGSEHVAWLNSMGINYSSGYSATFPTYSVRDSATLWMHMWNYLNTGTETAQWLGGLLSKTELSFLRNGVEQAGMEDATVYNKAGWCASTSGVEDAVNDAGIVVDGDNVYLVVAFTSTPDGETAEANLADLFEALLQTRHSLDASSATWENVEVATASNQDNSEAEVIVNEE